MKYESLYRLILVALLAAILVVQLLILARIPPGSPTSADLQSAKAEQRREMLLRIPLARVAGTVDVDVNNTPLEVELQR